MVKKPIKKMTKQELLKELESRSADNVTIKDCHLESKVVFDSDVVDLMGDIAVAVLVGNRTLEAMAASLSASRVKVDALVKIGTEIKEK